MMTKKSSERPRSEPEIILPGNQPDSGIWASKTTHGTHRIYVTRLGPFGINLFAAAIIGAIFMLAVVLLLGFFLIWILPLIVTLIIIAVVIRFARRIFTDNK
jgi:hypothetical protein